MFSYEPILSYNNFNLVANTAIEFRLKDIDDGIMVDNVFDIRELYLEWITPIGDFSIGKQIISWGSASANNPTDNISPYNYYYLFSLGNEQKEGVLAFNSIIYWNELTLNSVFIPFHNTHVLPLNDPEFAISTPIVPKDEQINDMQHTPFPLSFYPFKVSPSYEYGFSINVPLESADITASYYSGNDRIMSFFGANLWTGQDSNPEAVKPDTVLSYRRTNMFGLGFASYSDNISFKWDLGYFITDDQTINIGDSTLYRYWEWGVDQIIQECEEYNIMAEFNPIFQEIEDCYNDPKFNNSEIIDNRAKYYQITLEMEYSPTNDFIIIGQITDSRLLEIGTADSIKYSGGTIMFDPAEYFMPGMGSPNTFMSDYSISLIAQKSFPDKGLEIKYLGIYDLYMKGSINELGFDYEISNNLHFLGAINKIKSNNTKENQFSAMEDFSHLRLEIKYFY
jgi:hypothetical protein